MSRRFTTNDQTSIISNIWHVIFVWNFFSSSSCGRISYEYHNENDPALHSGKFFLNFWKILAFFFKWNFEKYKLIKIVRNVPRDLYSKYNNCWYHQVLKIKFFRKNVCVQWKKNHKYTFNIFIDIQNSEIHQQQGWLLIFFPPLY